MDDDIIKITLFGSFTITYHGQTLEMTKHMGKQLLNLFELIVYYRNSTSSKDIIINTLWADNDNPANAMKYSVFRLRTYLNAVIFLKDLELITTGAQGYVLNPDYQYYIDTEIFDSYYQKIRKMSSFEESIPYITEMLNLYQGDIYTPDSNANIWVNQANTYYASIYQNMVNRLCIFRMEEKSYDAVTSIASRAAMLMPEYENAHVWYLKALLKEGKIDKALEYYQKVVKMFSDVYDQSVSEELRALYPAIMVHNKQMLNIMELQSQLNESTLHDGAFYCEYDVFEYMYQNAVRARSRSTSAYFLILFNMLSCPENQEIKMMDKLKHTVSHSLRSSDIFTRVNKIQLAVLLQSKNEDGAYVAAQRILKNFNKKVMHKVKLAYYIKAI